MKLACEDLLLEEAQPVKKAPLLVHRVDDRLMVGIVNSEGQNEQVGGGIGGAGPAANQDLQTVIIRQNFLEQLMHQCFAQMFGAMNDERKWNARQFKMTNNNIRVFGGTIEGSLRIQQANSGRTLQHRLGAEIEELEAEEVQDMATLSSSPRTPRQLWTEFKFGIDGRKPAEQFTEIERNRRVGGMKQKYYRRNVVWQCIQRLTNKGHTVDAAICKIYECYGHRECLSNIINKMIADRRTGGHPSLR